MQVKGQIVDIHAREIYSGVVEIENGKVQSLQKENHDEKQFIIPGFVDAHIHIESSMLVPSEFARIAVKHGTVATVSDPHEIGNVLGMDGVYFMIENGAKTPFKFNFGAPSCVPATSFESAGAIIDSEGIKQLLSDDRILYLAEMMNYPGVIFDDDEVHRKIKWAHHYKKPVDGHAPGVIGEDLDKYIAAGISTDHECFTYAEGLEKIQKGMKVLIREGSAAKNFDALIPLLKEFPDKIMFCSDDKHPDDLLIDHINRLCARAVSEGCDVFDVLRAASLHPVEHYNLDVGLLRVGDPADFAIVEDLKKFKVLKTLIGGEEVFSDGQSKIEKVDFEILNNFSTNNKSVHDFELPATTGKLRVIEALDGQLVTRELHLEGRIEHDNLVSDTVSDVLKMTVVNRYNDDPPSIAFIKNFGLIRGAIASSVGHDSHNIIAVGADDRSIAQAVNLLIENKGGICAVDGEHKKVLPLPVAGIMSDLEADEVGRRYAELDAMAKELGSRLKAPYMTLSFMALLVIPQLKLSDKGLFDGATFQFVDLQIDGEL
jgi:adenine deaminase